MLRAPRPWLARGLALALAGLALLPLVSLAVSWAEYLRDVGLPLTETTALGFDGVRWDDADGRVVAQYVLPNAAGDRAGILEGDVLTTIDFLEVRTADEARRQSERATGTVLTYGLEQDSATRTADVRVERYPTFLYPLSTALWVTTGWAFGVVLLLHLLAYLTVAPLAPRSRRALRSKHLIGAALLWVGVQAMRWLWVTVFGPPPAVPTPGRAVFDAMHRNGLTYFPKASVAKVLVFKKDF